ncbi:MAG: glucan biosynthesis protein [Onishia taeanensis]|uniref:glucan biosynthesis protein n=1 Tax=Onishia taeanensis TaxID=284577 RepID=UPI003C7D7D64
MLIQRGMSGRASHARPDQAGRLATTLLTTTLLWTGLTSFGLGLGIATPAWAEAPTADASADANLDAQSSDVQSPDVQSPDEQSPDEQSPSEQSPSEQSPDAQGLESQSSGTVATDATTSQSATGAKTSMASLDALYDEVTSRAKQLAQAPFEAHDNALPEVLQDMDYDRYRQIRFRPEKALWRDQSLFEVQLFHTGFLYDQPVGLNLVESRDNSGQVEVSPLPFDQGYFRYDDAAAPIGEALAKQSSDDQARNDIGYAGFRLHYPLNHGDYRDEFMVFLGASYFRLIGRDQIYGLSARGLAIDTASPQGEEFPAFTDFWLVKPAPDATHIQVLALLDSPSVSGAYRFDITPGESSTVDVQARLFAREDVKKLGIAPLTSMFWHGSLERVHDDDYRPRVHDSNGLSMHTAKGEWIWRPLSNPSQLHISSLRDDTPQGFGLVQRLRAFDDYLDMEARYDLRPSQWVTPQGGDWGSGGVELVEIPTENETNDNIIAYWVPDAPFKAGESRTYRYRTSTFGAYPPTLERAGVVHTRQGWGGVPGQDDPPPKSRRHFIVDFRGGELSSLDASQPVEMTLTTSSGETLTPQVQPLPDGKTWRASFRLQPDGDQPADMRLSLTLRGQPLTETWNYVWYPGAAR